MWAEVLDTLTPGMEGISAQTTHSSEPEAPAPVPSDAAVAGVQGRPGQHLLKHAVSPAVQAAALAEFGADPVVAGTAICKLRQPHLRAMFTKVFGVQTNSGNNNWMRGKLLQAVGLPNRWRPGPEEEPACGSQQWADKQRQGRKRHGPSSPEEECSKRVRPSPPAFQWANGLPGMAPRPGSNQPMVVVVLPGGQLPPWVAGQLGNSGSEGGLHPAAGGFATWPQQQAQHAQQAQRLPLQQYGSGCSVTGPTVGEPQQQLLVLQAATHNPGATMEQATLTALQALGLMPPGASLPGSLQPAVVTPQHAASFDSGPNVHPSQPVLLPPGQVGSCPWPVVLPASFEEQQAVAVHSAAMHAAMPQRPAGQQFWQQQQRQQQPVAALQYGGFAAQPPLTTGRSASVPLSIQSDLPAVQCVAAMPFTAGPSPFAEAASVPLPSSSAAESEQQEVSEARHALGRAEPQAEQQVEQAGCQQAQAGEPAPGAAGSTAGTGARAAQPSLRVPECSLMADLKALEAMGWSASLANLPMASADLQHLFKAWQDGRISLSLAPDLKIMP